MRKIAVLAISMLAVGSMGISNFGVGVAGGGSSTANSFDQIININNDTNACSTIMAALKTYNDTSETTPMIYITGTASIDETDFHRAQYKDLTTLSTNNAPWKYCFGEIPASTFSGDYPIADGTNNSNNLSRGRIHFENVELNVSCTGQTLPMVVYQMGDAWLGGRDSGEESVFSGGVTQGPQLSGNLSIRYTADCDGSFAAGRVVERSTSALFSQATTMVAVWMNGVQRRDMRSLHLNLVGTSGDNDDIGILHDGLSSSNEWGYTSISQFGIGVMVAGPVISSFNGGYWSGNDYGLLLGDPLNAGDNIAADTCVAGTSTGDCGVYGTALNHPRFNNIVIEGNNYTEVAMFEGGTAVTFNSTHIESVSNPSGHGVIVGAGICQGGTRDQQMGATADDCPSGTFSRASAYPTGSCAGSARSFSAIRFNGGYVPGDKGAVSTPDWGGLMIGNCANDSSSKVIIAAELVNSTISGPTSVAFQFAPELTMPNMPQVDVTNALRTGSFYWPAYANLFHNGALSIPWQVNAASWTSGQYIPFGGDITAGVAVSSIFAGVPLPWAHLINYQVHHLDIGAFAAHTGNQTCNFVPVKLDYDHGTVSDVTGTTAAFTGNPITAGLRFYFNYAPGSATVWSTASDHDKVGLRVENGSNCDELFASGAVTLLPLE